MPCYFQSEISANNLYFHFKIPDQILNTLDNGWTANEAIVSLLECIF